MRAAALSVGNVRSPGELDARELLERIAAMHTAQGEEIARLRLVIDGQGAGPEDRRTTARTDWVPLKMAAIDLNKHPKTLLRQAVATGAAKKDGGRWLVRVKF